MVPHKLGSESFITFLPTISQVYNASTKPLGVFFRQKDTSVGTLDLQRCLPMLGYENLEWKKNVDIIIFDNNNEEAGHRVCNCFWKKKRVPNVALSLKVCFCWLVEIQIDGTKTLCFPHSNGKLCYKNAEMKLRCQRNMICWPTKTTPKGLVQENKQTNTKHNKAYHTLRSFR